MGVTRVAVIHPWLPHYRVRFFADLSHRLRSEGIKLSVLHGDPPPEVRGRRDSVDVPWAKRLPSRTLRVGSRALIYKQLPADLKSCDLVIVEQAVRNLETYRVLMESIGSHRRVAFWGHGRTYTRHHHAVEEWWKQVVTRRGSWFFAYTDGGARYVARRGFDAARITVVNNTLDTEELAHAVELTRARGQRDTPALLGVDPRFTCLFIGGLDSTKRLDFLLAAGDRISMKIPDFTLLVAGDGDMHHVIEQEARSTKWLRYVGRADAQCKAKLAGISRLMLMPGRVGLVAVDSFVLGTPIVTTNWPLHGPEFEYLRTERNSVISEDNVADYADEVVALLSCPDRVDLLRTGCDSSMRALTLGQMVENFATGVQAALVA